MGLKEWAQKLGLLKDNPENKEIIAGKVTKFEFEGKEIKISRMDISHGIDGDRNISFTILADWKIVGYIEYKDDKYNSKDITYDKEDKEFNLRCLEKAKSILENKFKFIYSSEYDTLATKEKEGNFALLSINGEPVKFNLDGVTSKVFKNVEIKAVKDDSDNIKFEVSSNGKLLGIAHHVKDTGIAIETNTVSSKITTQDFTEIVRTASMHLPEKYKFKRVIETSDDIKKSTDEVIKE